MDLESTVAGAPAGIWPAFVVALVGLLIPALLVLLLSKKMADANQWKASELVSLAGLFTGIVGTLVGAFLGVQVGAQGKDAAEKQTALADKRATKAEARADSATQKFMRAFMALPADQQKKFGK